MKWSRDICQATDQASSTEAKVILKIQVSHEAPSLSDEQKLKIDPIKDKNVSETTIKW